MCRSVLLTLLLVRSIRAFSQTSDFTPSIRINERMASYPSYLKNGLLEREMKHLPDLTTAHSSTTNAVSTEVDPVKSSKNDEREPQGKMDFGNFNIIEGLTDAIKKLGSKSSMSMGYKNANASNRFFNIDTSKQNLNLGISFSIPFFSIPMASLLSIGESTSTALGGMLNLNWPSFIMTALLVGGASLLIPKVTGVLMSMLTQYGFPDNLLAAFGNKFRGGDNMSSYSEYLRKIEIAPFTSILNQIDEAMKEYDLDSTSCMQRVVCSYVSEAETAADSNSTDPSMLIIKGITRSPWIQGMLGDNALTEALEVGRKGVSCAKQFSKCPFSLAGILKLITRFVALNR